MLEAALAVAGWVVLLARVVGGVFGHHWIGLLVGLGIAAGVVILGCLAVCLDGDRSSEAKDWESVDSLEAAEEGRVGVY